jgi:dipeptidyl aminopeptidase/acylaminoacyl peptidase
MTRTIRQFSLGIFLSLIGLLPTRASLFGQTPRPQPARLTIDRIMDGPDFSGTQPAEVRWSVDGKSVYFRWKKADEKKEGVYVVAADGGTPRRLSEDEERLAPPFGGVENDDRTRKLFVDDGDIFIMDLQTGTRRQLTQTTAVESAPGFTLNPDHIYFTRDSNLYLLSLSSGALAQLTDFRRGPAPKDPKSTDSQKFIEEEQRNLFAAVKEKADDRKQNDDKQKKRERIKPFYLAQKETVRGLQLSPNEKWIMFFIDEDQEGTRNTIVPDYVTVSGYVEDINARSNVGDLQRKSKLGVQNVPAEGDAEATLPRWIENGLAPRAAQFNRTVWSPDGKDVVSYVFSDDRKDRWLALIDPAAAKVKILDHLHDDAWVGGPGLQNLGWLPDSSAVYFVSEKTGFAHLYTVTPAGAVTQWTDGNWEVFNPVIAPDRKNFFFTSSEVHFGERHFYKMAIGSRERIKLTSMTGNNEVTPSPDGTRLASVYSYSNKPWELYVDGKKVTDSTAEDFKKYPWRDPEIVMVPARDGVQVPARLYKLATVARGGPAVIFVHGAGYAQNVHKYWASGYSREYMFHNFLADNGYVVLDLDYRASAGHGRDWRTAIYRHMGGVDLTDQVDGAKYLVERYAVDAKRIGIYGGSYGGFITLMAMFTTPDVFAAGAALRPVTDWSHYNHNYTSDILNLPQTDPEAYKQSSPIYFAQGLKGALLICHGMVDTNVPFQDSVRLAQRLIELKKENWDFAMFPVENHGFTKSSSWADEYKRIYKLFETNLKAKTSSSN